MNKVHIETKVHGTKFTFAELMKISHKGKEHTAFIGCWGDREEVHRQIAELYLITYDEVVLASDPSQIWSHSDGTVIRFCDVVVTIEETS